MKFSLFSSWTCSPFRFFFTFSLRFVCGFFVCDVEVGHFVESEKKNGQDVRCVELKSIVQVAINSVLCRVLQLWHSFLKTRMNDVTLSYCFFRAVNQQSFKKVVCDVYRFHHLITKCQQRL